MWGCNGKALQPLTIDGEEDDTCPRRPMMDPEDATAYGELFGFANAFEHGILPEDGGLQSQPYRLMQLVRFIQNFRAECMEEKRNQPRSTHSI